MKAVVFILAASALCVKVALANITSGASTADQTKTYHDETTSSPLIELTCQEPNDFRGSAAGFFINSGGSFVTARHVIETFEKMIKTRRCLFVAFASQYGWSRQSIPLQVKGCIKSQIRDIGVCTVEPNPFTLPDFTVSAPTWPKDRLKRGIDVTEVGFPNSVFLADPAIIHGTVALYDEMKFTCKSSTGQSTWLSGPSLWLKSSRLSPSTTEGMSGGPVLLTHGQDGRDVIAGMFVCFGGSYVIAIPIDSILQFLHEQHIETESS